MTSLPPFESIVATHGATVFRVCRAVVGPVDADDAWSETFLAALKAYPSLPPTTNMEAWLVTVANRKAIDVLRGRMRRPIPEEHLPEHASSTGRVPSDDFELWQSVAALPEKQRQAVAYHHLAGFPYKEVAVIVGGSADAVRRAAADGIAALRRELSPPGGGVSLTGSGLEQREHPLNPKGMV